MVDPTNNDIFWSWGSALSTQGMWTIQLLQYLSSVPS
jgi:hypothetical protein